MIKAHSSGRIVSCDTSDVVIASVHSNKNHMKKLMIISKNIMKKQMFFLWLLETIKSTLQVSLHIEPAEVE